MPKKTVRPYHHGRLRESVLRAAVEEVEAVGAANISMREIARRAGVSHAAPAHHFGDKAGIFTAIAAEGFRMISDVIEPVAAGPHGFLPGGVTYVRFALEHRGHFEVMFRPDLCRMDDPELVVARERAFQILYASARAAVQNEDDVTGLVLAGWSMSHGFATLWLTANLEDKIGPDPAALPALIAEGVVTLGKVTQRQLRSAGRRPRKQ